MSLFEFVLTGFTLVLALVITRILAGLRWVLNLERLYWVHAVFVISILILTSLVWWGLWYQRDSQWSYVSFAYNLLVGPGIMFYLAVLLVPEIPRRIRDWRVYYYNVRPALYWTFLLFVVALFFGGVFITGVALFDRSQFIMLAGAIVAVVGILSDRHAVHASIAVVLGCLAVVSVGLAVTSTEY